MSKLFRVLTMTVLIIGTALGQTQWTAYTEGPVLAPDPNGWDHSVVINGGILDYQDTLRMWYHAYPQDNIGYAWSLDGIEWTRHATNPVLRQVPDTWESGQVGRAIVIPVDGQFIMMYRGFSTPRYQIGIAYAPNIWGPWTKEASNPVISSLDLDAGGTASIAPIGFEYKDGVYHAWFSWYKEGDEEDRYCHATSESLTEWVIDSTEVITGCGPEGTFNAMLYPGCSIVKVEDTRYLLYRGKIAGDATWYHGLATSISDGPYQHSIWNPVISVQPSGYWYTPTRWSYPYMIYDQERHLFRMWFTSYMNNTSNAGIGYAESLLGYRGVDLLDIQNAQLRVRYEGNSEITLFARLYKGDNLVDEVQLHDDGLHQDLLATDSIFGCSLPDGEYSIKIAAYKDTSLIIEYLEVEEPVIVSIDYAVRDLISSFRLEQNFPNPFNPSTTILYSLPSRSKVNITIYDVIGNEVVEILNETKLAGEYELVWNRKDGLGKNVSTGVYFCRLKAGEHEQTIKMLFLK